MREDVQQLPTSRGSMLAEYEPVGARGVLIREGCCAKTNPMGHGPMNLGIWALGFEAWVLGQDHLNNCHTIGMLIDTPKWGRPSAAPLWGLDRH